MSCLNSNYKMLVKFSWWFGFVTPNPKISHTEEHKTKLFYSLRVLIIDHGRKQNASGYESQRKWENRKQ